ncbi:MAG: STAS domain-containing protein, partial [Planctomycetota bacterium]
MQIEEKVQNDVVVLKVSKDLTTGQDVAPFHERIKSLSQGGANKVVVDFSSVRWFGSAMLGGLIAGLTTLRSAGGDLRL